MVNAKEYRDKDSKALNEELLALLKEQFNLRMQSATGQLAHTHHFKRVRRDIARIKTVMTEMKKAEA